jgi:hypothetical protein
MPIASVSKINNVCPLVELAKAESWIRPDRTKKHMTTEVMKTKRIQKFERVRIGWNDCDCFRKMIDNETMAEMRSGARLKTQNRLKIQRQRSANN